MAEGKVLIELQLIQKGDKLSIVAKDTKKLSKETKKAAKAQKELDHKTGGARRQLHAMAGMTSNTTKSFSKMQQGLGTGSSGLVGAYATLAANVFAATAAFMALRSAAQTQQLIQGLEAVGAASGQNLRALAEDVRDAADGALSLDAALRSAAVGASAQFTAQQLIGLTRVAKGAALALGRDIGDAQDRLVRGAAKLEPEILDELGIFVRLDDATEKYAATIGKTASQLTNFQRRQAFVNAILEQGDKKFSDISDAVDPNPYDRLAATMEDLSRTVLNFINSVLGPFAALLADNTMLLAGLFAMITKGIVKSALPFLGKMSQKMGEFQMKILGTADAQAKAAKIEVKTHRDSLKGIKRTTGAYADNWKAIKAGTATKKQMAAAEKDLQRLRDDAASKNTAYMKRKQAEYDLELAKLRMLKIAVADLGKQRALSRSGAALATFEGAGSGIIGKLDEPGGGGIKGYKKGMKEALGAGKTFRADMSKSGKVSTFFGKSIGGLGKPLMKASTFITSFGIAGRVAIKGLFTAIPFIGQLLFILDLLLIMLKKLIKWLGSFGREASEFAKANKALKTSIKSTAKALDDSNIKERSRSQQLEISAAAVDSLIAAMDRQSLAQKKSYAEAGLFGKLWIGAIMKIRKMIDLLVAVFDDFGLRVRIVFARIKLGLATAFSGEKTMKFFNAIIKSINWLNRNTGQEPIELITLEGLEDTIKEATTNLADLRLEFEATTDISTIAAIDSGALKAFHAFEAVLLASGPAADELRASLTDTDINTFVKTMAEGGDVVSLFSKEMKGNKDIMALFDWTTGKVINQEKFFSVVLEAGTRTARDHGNAIKALGTAFEEEGTKLDKFMTSMGKKSSVDEALAALTTFNEQMVIMGNNTEGISEKWESASKATKRIIDGVGEGAISRIQEIIDAEEKKQETFDKGSKEYEKSQNKINQAQYWQGKFIKDATQKTLDLFKLRNKLELTEKAILSKLKRQTKAIGKAGKSNSAAIAAGIELTNTSLQTSIDLLDTKITTEKASLGLLGDQKKTKEELAEMDSSEKNRYFTMLGLIEERATKAEKIVGTAEKSLLIQQADLAIAKSRNALYKAEADAQAKILKTQNIIANAAKGIGAKLTPAQALKAAKTAAAFTTAAARLELELMTKRFDLEMDILEVRLLAAGVEKKKVEDILVKMREQLKITKQIQDQKILGLEAQERGVTATGGGGIQSWMQGPAAQIIQDAELGKERIDQQLADRRQIIQDKLDKLDPVEDKNAFDDLTTQLKNASPSFLEQIDQMRTATKTLGEELAKLGPEGEYASALFSGVLNIVSSFEILGDSSKDVGERIAALGSIMASIGSIAAASSKAKIAGIDQEINAEKKRDGKSKESLAKIKALEAKKEAAKRKAFEQNKKVKMAEAIISTASAIAKHLGDWPMMILIAAMGAAQLAIISGTSYQGGSAGESPSVPAKIEVGKRTNKVDVSQQASAGELAYLRGQRGIGTTATNFVPGGGAAGLRKGYAEGGTLVGERGPEMIQTAAAFNIIPNDALGGKNVTANFSIHAIDAVGVEEVLMAQQGNIINMIRSAANDYGEEFLETINTDTYGESSSGTYGGG